MASPITSSTSVNTQTHSSSQSSSRSGTVTSSAPATTSSTPSSSNVSDPWAGYSGAGPPPFIRSMLQSEWSAAAAATSTVTVTKLPSTDSSSAVSSSISISASTVTTGSSTFTTSILISTPTSDTSPTPTPTSASGADTSASGLSTGAKAGIGVGVGIGAVVIIGLIVAVLLLWRRIPERRNNNKAQSGDGDSSTAGFKGFHAGSWLGTSVSGMSTNVQEADTTGERFEAGGAEYVAEADHAHSVFSPNDHKVELDSPVVFHELMANEKPVAVISPPSDAKQV